MRRFLDFRSFSTTKNSHKDRDLSRLLSKSLHVSYSSYAYINSKSHQKNCSHVCCWELVSCWSVWAIMYPSRLSELEMRNICQMSNDLQASRLVEFKSSQLVEFKNFIHDSQSRTGGIALHTQDWSTLHGSLNSPINKGALPWVITFFCWVQYRL